MPRRPEKRDAHKRYNQRGRWPYTEAQKLERCGETPKTTNLFLNQLLSTYLCRVSQSAALQPELVFQRWSEIVGPQIASMAKAYRFDRYVLHVSVKNSTLLSILSSQSDKMRLLQRLVASLPGIEIKDIAFRFG